MPIVQILGYVIATLISTWDCLNFLSLRNSFTKCYYHCKSDNLSWVSKGGGTNSRGVGGGGEGAPLALPEINSVYLL